MAALRILSVGQCGYDHGRISRYLRDTFGAETVRADSADEALEALRRGAYGLVLVNRLLDEDGSSGLDLLRALKADDRLAAVPTMLVSNYAEAQAEATGLGSLPGFGKADLGKPSAHAALAAALTPADAGRPAR